MCLRAASLSENFGPLGCRVMASTLPSGPGDLVWGYRMVVGEARCCTSRIFFGILRYTPGGVATHPCSLRPDLDELGRATLRPSKCPVLLPLPAHQRPSPLCRMTYTALPSSHVPASYLYRTGTPRALRHLNRHVHGPPLTLSANYERQLVSKHPHKAEIGQPQQRKSLNALAAPRFETQMCN